MAVSMLRLMGIFNGCIHIGYTYNRENRHHHFLLNKQMILGDFHDDHPHAGIHCNTQLIQDIAGALSYKGCLGTAFFRSNKRYQLL